MTWFLPLLAAFNLLGALVTAVFLEIGRRVCVRMETIEPEACEREGREPWPTVSLIVPAKDEARSIEAAVRSLLTLDYPRLEITVVNDRSTDATGEILDRLASENPALNIVHLTDLPAGWLGKNHALQLGADRSHGEWFLFTDADVIYEPSALRRAMHYAREHELDHLTCFPHLAVRPWLLQVFCVAFGMLLSLHQRLWKIRDPKSPAHIGIGAFNLLRAEVYRHIDGHRPIALRPDDDLKLGKLVKLRGFRQDMLAADRFIVVEWYHSVGELIHGLEKNMFAGTEYRVTVIAAATLALVAFHLLPFAAPFFVGGVARWLYVATAVVWLVAAVRMAGSLRQPWSAGLGYPVGIAAFIFIMLRTTTLNLWQGGLRWRGTFYSLRELKQNRL